MRITLAAALLLIGAPALGQNTPRVDQRVDRLEREMRAVQRKVFPNGGGTLVAPEITPQTSIAAPAGAPATSATADLTARLDALEGQLARLTGQTEENANRLRQLEANLASFKAEADARLSAPPPAEPAPAQPEPQSPPPDTSADPGEQAYLTGYRQWDAKDYAAAQKSLEAMVKTYPDHARASHAQNLVGRAWLDDGKPATAAKHFLANYQTNPKGERAADSLYFLGQALTQLDKKEDACKAYDELTDVYGRNMRDWVKQRLPKARADAGCS